MTDNKDILLIATRSVATPGGCMYMHHCHVNLIILARYNWRLLIFLMYG